MKKLVWIAGLLLVTSLVFPNGPSFNWKKPGPSPTPAPAVKVDAEIVKLLNGSPAEDRARIRDVYTSLKVILQRPTAPQRVTTTEKWEELHGRTLELAIDQVGKYPTLDEQIERVFLAAVGTDDVLPGNPETFKKLMEACDTVAGSAAAAK
jgi:hypothetical protein